MNSRQNTFTFVNRVINKTEGTVFFYYSIQTYNQLYTFTHTISFPSTGVPWETIPDTILESVLNNLHLILGISYWKTFCPKTIVIPHMQLTKQQAFFWNTLYTKGLGEFFYKNSLDYHNLVQFPYTEKKHTKPPILLREHRSLLYFGGGKDSIVSAELLKKYDKPFTLFIEGSSTIHSSTEKLVDRHHIIFERTFDPLLFAVNKIPGVYNGHIPISAVWAFLGLFAAVLYNYDSLITSNEHSASFGNVIYLGSEINHQWSKSFEFESLFSEYIASYVTPSISYFSLLRPLHEMKITQIFTRFQKYFPYFSSCNRNFKIHNNLQGKNWCGECPKCVFVYIMLSAFLPKETVISLFGKNILMDPKLFTLCLELLGEESFKPFECVGTPEETQLAMYYIDKNGEYPDSKILQQFHDTILPRLNIATLENNIFSPSLQHNLTDEFEFIIKNL